MFGVNVSFLACASAICVSSAGISVLLSSCSFVLSPVLDDDVNSCNSTPAAAACWNATATLHAAVRRRCRDRMLSLASVAAVIAAVAVVDASLRIVSVLFTRSFSSVILSSSCFRVIVGGSLDA